MNSIPAPNVPVIVNYISCAGWLSRHFYDYYRYTGDEKLLKEAILSFMLEAAAFFENYVLRDANGKITIIPSVSPENTLDFYYHCHLSHIYPLFPGEEITPESPLFDAFVKAVDLRELGTLSGWALAHMSAVYACMARGNRALDCLNILARGCLMNNLFTLHNDWRDMGVSLWLDVAPVQMDALMGAVNALQELLLYAAPDKLAILPACPDVFDKGEVKNWCFPGGWISFAWNRSEGRLMASITDERKIRMRVRFPVWSGIGNTEISMEAGETKQFATV